MLLTKFCQVRSGPDVFLGERDSGPFYFNVLLGRYQRTDCGGTAAQREARNVGFKDCRDSGRVVGAHRLEKAMNKITAIRREPFQVPEAFTALSPIPLLRTTPRVAVRRP